MYSHILVPIAPGHGDEAHGSLNAARALLAEGGRITVLVVFQEFPRYLGLDAAGMADLLDQSLREVREQMTQTFGGPDVDVVVVNGHPTRTILDHAKQANHDCIVVASHLPGWQHVFLGSTASGVVRHAHCSVHVYREPGEGPLES